MFKLSSEIRRFSSSLGLCDSVVTANLCEASWSGFFVGVGSPAIDLLVVDAVGVVVMVNWSIGSCSNILEAYGDSSYGDGSRRVVLRISSADGCGLLPMGDVVDEWVSGNIR